MEWVTVATAPDQLTAEAWRELLLGKGVPAVLQAGDAVSFLGVSPFPCRLLVPRERVDDARRLLDELEEAAPLTEEVEDTP